jgi:DNA repair protein RecO (recombination protein O)
VKCNREESQPVYVLHTRPYRESSLLVECFSKNHGRVSLVARGVRQAKSRRAGLLQPFVPLLISWVGRTELYTLCQLESESAQQLFSGEQLLCGLYTNELLMRLLQREDPHPELYEAYEKLLCGLAQQSHPERSLRLFEKDLLMSLGYAFSFEAIQKENFYVFEASHGLIKTNIKSNNSFSGESILALEKDDLLDEHLKEIKKLMRMALFSLLNDKPLRTRELFL